MAKFLLFLFIYCYSLYPVWSANSSGEKLKKVNVLSLENIEARQRYPWNGNVDIAFDLQGIPSHEFARLSFFAEGGDSPIPLNAFIGNRPENLGNGTHHLIWDASADLPPELFPRLKLKGEARIQIPPLPQGVSAVNYPDMKMFIIYWDGCPGASSYQVWKSEKNDPVTARLLGSYTDTFCYDDSIDYGTAYHYWIKALSSGGASAFSQAVKSTYTESLDVPENIDATDGVWDDQIDIRWSSVAGAASYEIWRSVDQDISHAQKIGDTSTPRYRDRDGLVPGKNYFYWVKAVGKSGIKKLSSFDSGFCHENLLLSIATDCPELIFRTGGTEGWFGQTKVSSDGRDSAQSGIMMKGGESWFSSDINGPGTLSFYWKGGATRTDGDSFSFSVDRSVKASALSDEWKRVTVEIPFGSHTVTWRYRKRSTSASPLDSVWVDRIKWMPRALKRYLIIDLLPEDPTAGFPVSDRDFPPSGGWGEEFKNRKLVLRRIDPGKFTMQDLYDELGYIPGYSYMIGNDHPVTLTRPYYIGVFEITQFQWQLVMGTRPSYFSNDSYYTSRPVERVSCNMIRGARTGWPFSLDVAPESFMGVLRSKTCSSHFDLPTEAQWEYACRTDKVVSHENCPDLSGMTVSPKMNLLGRYDGNNGNHSFPSSTCSTSMGSAKVGSYEPNGWGLYDMRGNVSELCVDWACECEKNFSITNPAGAVEGWSHVTKGGGWNSFLRNCHSASRSTLHPEEKNSLTGFRLAFCDCRPWNMSFYQQHPGGVDASDWLLSTGIAVSWDPSLGATSYEVYRIPDDHNSHILTPLAEVSGTNYVDLTAEPGVRYRYSIRAVGKYGISDYSDWEYGTRGEDISLSEAADNGSLKISTGGKAPWFGQSAESYDGKSALRSGIISGTGSSWFEVQVSGPSLLSCWCKISSRYPNDNYLEILLDGVSQKRMAEKNSPWTELILDIPFGKHTVRWIYHQNRSALEDDSRAWVDRITLSERKPGRYIVIDLSGGTHALRYTVSYLDSEPVGGWSDLYKTSKLVLRRIEPGSFLMGSPEGELGRYSYLTDWEIRHRVTLTKPYYIGVFEVTQRQWELVMGDRPSKFSNPRYYASRPVERVTYNSVRGPAEGLGWPFSSKIDSPSFLGRLRLKTGIDLFELPTEAQWEYACRAGTTTALNSGENLTAETMRCQNLDRVGRYMENGGYIEYPLSPDEATTTSGTAQVGSYLPNNWGLYDMHGNVGELCLDLKVLFNNQPVTDPAGGSNRDYGRAVKGGGYRSNPSQCRSGERSSTGGDAVGFRITYSEQDLSEMFVPQPYTWVKATGWAPISGTEITWKPSYKAFSYIVYRGISPDLSSAVEIGRVSGTNYLDTTAVPGKLYYYGVKCLGDYGLSTFSQCAAGVSREDIPLDEAVDNPDLTFTVGGDGDWFGTSGDSHDGEDSARCGDFLSGSAWLETTVTGPGRLSFFWKITGKGYDSNLTFSIDGKPEYHLEGESYNGWEQRSIDLPNGEHVLRWNCENYDYGSYALIDRISWIPFGQNEAPYMVVDLSSGPYSGHYPVTYLYEKPYMEEETYKTDKLVLRHVSAGEYTAGSSVDEYGRYSDEPQRRVKLENSFYMGVFEVTQRQWELVMGKRPSWFTNSSCYASRPVEQVSYSNIRGYNKGRQWPCSSAVDSTSFMGRLRSRTGISCFDLPTENQWEYASRAGQTYQYDGRDQDGSGIHYDECFSYCTDYYGTAGVGTYYPNNWGFYDMYGNVLEWCLDWYTACPGESTFHEKLGPISGNERVLKGGSWARKPRNCRPAYRTKMYSWKETSETGFRVCLTVPFMGSLNSGLDFSSVRFFTGENDSWQYNSYPSSDGNDSVKCTLSQNQNSSQFGTAVIGPGVVSFQWGQDGGNGLLEFKIDDVQQAQCQPYYYLWWRQERIVVGPGKHILCWNFRRTDDSGGNAGSAYVDQFTWTPEETCKKRYMVIDLSGGQYADRYPVTYLSETPFWGWSDTYKTTKLLLRLVPAGKFQMGSPEGELGRNRDEEINTTWLRDPFYMGVFEVTQKQWELVMGNRPSYFSNTSCYETRPVESVSFDQIRGDYFGAIWPRSNRIDSWSFIGRIRSKTGIDVLDLPTEAQWEYACRAGTSTALNNGQNLTSETSCRNLNQLGRYVYNAGNAHPSGETDVGTAEVGSFLPNNWELYDMHGNVWEWCLDWYEAEHGYGDQYEPVGPVSGSKRLNKGGSWENSAKSCRSATRGVDTPSVCNKNTGFRLVCPSSKEIY